jgi:hypothetical protein
MGQRLERSLLDNVLDIRVTANRSPHGSQQRPEMGSDQVSEEFSTPAKDIANQFDFLRGYPRDRNHPLGDATERPILSNARLVLFSYD